MLPFVQLCKKIKSLLQYLFCYLLGAVAIIAVFSGIYFQYGIDDSLGKSIKTFWAMENTLPESVIFWVYCEKIVRDLFSFVLVGYVFLKYLAPINPILFSKYIAYDTVDRKMQFRYWIMLPKGQYLYDIRIRLMLTNYESYQKGVNRLDSLWQMDEDKLELEQARGIRFVELTEQESADLIGHINAIKEKHMDEWGKPTGDYYIALSIRGSNESGVTYYGWHSYHLEDVLFGYRYVPLQRHQYASEDFYREKNMNDEELRKINLSEDFYREGKKEFFRYQHFNKVYRLDKSLYSLKADKNKDVLSKEQIIHGQYKGIRQLVLDLMSFSVWYVLDTDRKLRWILGKAGQYMLHVLHIRRC